VGHANSAGGRALAAEVRDFSIGRVTSREFRRQDLINLSLNIYYLYGKATCFSRFIHVSGTDPTEIDEILPPELAWKLCGVQIYSICHMLGA
jgi:hypothetical protein